MKDHDGAWQDELDDRLLINNKDASTLKGQLHHAFSHRGLNEFNDVLEALSGLKDSDKAPLPEARLLAAAGGGAKGAAYTGTTKAMEATGDLDSIRFTAGASAGAINAFIIGLGFDASQIERLTKSIDFRDFNDYVRTGLGKHAGGYQVLQGLKGLLGSDKYIFSGDNFYDWVRGVLEHTTGDADITFAEFEMLAQSNPLLKNMVFKAYKYRPREGETAETTFSCYHTPDVRICDALRASMSLPLVFKPWEIYEKDKEGHLKLFGVFADGGLKNNFPIDVGEEECFEDPHYPNYQKRGPNQSESSTINPTSVGLNLTFLKDLDPEVTPFTDRIKKLRQEAGIVEGRPRSNAVPSPNYSSYDIGSAVYRYWRGERVSEDVVRKVEKYKGQVIEVYSEEVGVMDFDISPERQDILKKSGEQAWYQWHAKFRDPSGSYEGKTSFDIDLNSVLREKNDNLREKIIKEYFRDIIYRMRVESDKFESCKGYANRTAEDSQFLKFHAHLILKTKEELKEIQGLNTLVDSAYEDAFYEADILYQSTEELKRQHRAVLEQYIQGDFFVEELKKLFHDSPERALILFKSKLSQCLDLVASHAGPENPLSLAAQSSMPEVLDEMLSTFQNNKKMLTQQARKAPLKRRDALEQAGGDHSLYYYALKSPKKLEMIDVLMRYGLNPLRTDWNGKTLLHDIVDAGDVEALQHVCDVLGVEKIKSLKFKPKDETIVHYMIQHGSNDFLESLWKDYPELRASLVDESAVDRDQVNVMYLSCDLAWRELSQERINQMSLLKLSSLALNRYRVATGQDLIDSQLLMKTILNSKGMKENSEKERVKNQDLIYRLISMSNDEKALKAFIKKNHLTAKKCLALLDTRLESESTLLQLGTYDPTVLGLIEKLAKVVVTDSKSKERLRVLLESKVEDKSLLYVAAENGNERFLRLFKDRFMLNGLEVDNAGPIGRPSALLIAAKNGHFECVDALIQSKMTWMQWLTTSRITRRCFDEEDKTPFHYLCMTGKNPEHFYHFLTAGIARMSDVSSIPDCFGKSPLIYLVSENPSAFDILNDLKVRGNGYIQNYMFDDYFDLTTIRDNGQSDLEWICKNRPEIGDLILTHLRDVGLKEHAKEWLQNNQAERNMIDDPQEPLAYSHPFLLGAGVGSPKQIARERKEASKETSRKSPPRRPPRPGEGHGG